MIDRDSQALKPAGKAFGIIQTWLVGARMDECKQATDRTWTCQLNRNGQLQWIVWNPEGSRSFAIPNQWSVQTVTPLLGEASPVSGMSLAIGPMPVLLRSAARRPGGQ
jgi:hypothetical protein